MDKPENAPFTMLELIEEEYLKPKGINLSDMAHELEMSTERLKAVLSNNDLSPIECFNLEDYFGHSRFFFYNIQYDFIKRNIEKTGRIY